jgi:beta-phosphoglucomutase-like phosphatase (HAD superfamily)
MKKAVIFDFFGVISTEVAPFWFEERFSPDKAAELKEKYMGPSDRGEASEDETFAALSALSGERAEDIREDFDRRVKINPEMVELIESLHEKNKVFCIRIIMVRVERTTRPGVIPHPVGKALHLHPLRTRPWRSHNLQVWIDGKYLL